MADDVRIRELLRRLHETGATPEEVCRDCPDLAGEVRERWARLRRFDAGLDAFFSNETDAGAPVAADDGGPAPRFPGYDVAEPLGAGGMGVVYRAREIASGRVVALKVVHPHLRRLPGFAERLLREAQIGRRVLHENVVRTFGLAADATRDASRQALVTEYVEGQTLRALLAEMGRVPERLCRHIGREIAKGLAAIHAIDAVHRDLKPENVIIARCAAPGHRAAGEAAGAFLRRSDGEIPHRCDNVVKVMDLGVAKLLGTAENLSQTGAFVGSLRYAAPEQIASPRPAASGTAQPAGAALDGRADLYALGLTLFELATGRYAFQADDAPRDASLSRLSAIGGPPRRAGELNPQLSPLFEELVATLLETDRERRFASAGDVAAILELGEESAWWRDRAHAIRGATRNPPRRIVIPRETAIHGRDAELGRLCDRFDRAANGDGQVVLVEGEAGAGKSRLIDEFAATLRRTGRDVHFVFGGHAPGGAATASGAFADAYREFFGDADLGAAIARHLPESPALVPAFAALLRGEPPPRGVEALTQYALQTAFSRTTQSLAAERPTVVVIEDLHFAPEEARALFAALAHAAPGHRLLLVGTARRALDAKWAADLRRLPHTSGLTIGRLGRPELTALLRDALRSTQVAEDLAPQIAGKSDGNPYFVFEILRDLRESRLLARSADGVWRATQAIRDIRSPSSITGLIAARIAELLPEERELLEVAACCGFEFDPLLVGDVLGIARLPLLRRLGNLESARRLVRSAGRSYVFDHHQVQEVLLSRLSATHRETYHAAIADSLERRSGAAGRDPAGLDGRLCADLAGHFLDGAAGARALRYLDAALEHLEKSARNESATRLLEQVLAAPGLVAGVRRGELLLRLSRCFERSGNLTEEARVLGDAIVLVDASDDVSLRADVRLAHGANLTHAQRHHEALDAFAAAEALYHRAGDLKGEARATALIGSVYAILGRYDEALDLGRRGIELSHEAGDARNEATAIGNMGNLFLMLGRHDEAQAHLERSAELCRTSGETRVGGRVAVNLGNLYWTLGRFAEAQEQYEEFLARSREFGDRIGEARATGNLAGIHTSLGRFAKAKAHGERCLAILQECASKTAEATAAANQGGLLTTLGRHDEAQALLERALAMAREIGSRRIERCALRYLGVRLSFLGRTADARALHERELAIARETGDPCGEAEALVCLGAIDREVGRPDDAVRHLDAAIVTARRVDVHTTLIVAAAERALLPSGDPEAAAALLAEFHARADVTDLLRARWVLWQATGRPDHLAEASRLLDHLVANAPPDCRVSMIENVRLHRDVRDAASARRPA